MLSRLTGVLSEVLADRARVQIGPAVVDVLVPGSDLEGLQAQVGQEITFHTLLVLEGTSQGTSMVPRLIGFSSAHDRSFFELFTTVKNIGHRKALRALQAPGRDIAAAISARNTAFLVALPEIGKRTAETIIAELSGKVDDWIDEASTVSPVGQPAAGTTAADAIAMLVALGERPEAARQLVDRAVRDHADVDSPEELLAHIMASR